MKQPPKFTHIVFSGGGFKGLVYIGIIRYLQQEGLDKGIRDISGTSMGAIIATFFALGIPSEIIEHEFSNINADGIEFNIADVMTFPETLGFTDGRRMMQDMKVYVGQLTFLQLAKKTGKNLVICATNVATMEPTYFSAHNTPDVFVLDAVKASMAIPLVFTPVCIDGVNYIDGGICHCIPLCHMWPGFISHENTTLVCSLSTKCLSSVTNGDILAYISNIINTHIQNHQAHDIIQCMFPYYVLIEHIPMTPMSFIIEDSTVYMHVPNKSQVHTCTAIGYNTMVTKFNSEIM
jgi:predicted acylesterase/phospholipase RssA